MKAGGWGKTADPTTGCATSCARQPYNSSFRAGDDGAILQSPRDLLTGNPEHKVLLLEEQISDPIGHRTDCISLPQGSRETARIPRHHGLITQYTSHMPNENRLSKAHLWIQNDSLP